MALFIQTLRLRLLGLLKIPLLASVRPTVVELDDDHCVIRVRLRRWTRNHLGSMYFGALAKVSLIFKSFQAEFLRRPDADVFFICAEGARIRALLDRVLASGERSSELIPLTAAVRGTGGYEPVARFQLELSLKPAERGLL